MAAGAGRGWQAHPGPSPGGARRDGADARFRSIIDGFGDPIVVLDAHLYVRYVNRALGAVLGYSPVDVLARSLRELLDADHRADLEARLRAHLDDGARTLTLEHGLRTRSGAREEFETTANRLAARGEQPMLVLHLRRVTERNRYQRELENERERLETALEAARAGTWLWDLERGEAAPDERWRALMGWTHTATDPVHPALWEALRHPHDAPVVEQALSRHLRGDRDRFEVEHRLRHDEGGWIWVRSLGRVVQWTDEGDPALLIGIDVDISEERERREQLRYASSHDPLTGLPNRSHLADLLVDALARAGQGEGIAVAHLDIDDLGAINERHGREVGDELLREIGQRLRAPLRDDDLLARVAGDEFVAVLRRLDRPDAWASAARRLLDVVEAPVVIDGRQIRVSASVGLTLVDHARRPEAEQLLRQAHQAMYEAKLAGKHRYHLFDLEDDEYTRERYERLGEIERALERGEFVLHYQPKVDLRRGHLVGLEALVRWQHPERGLLFPASFIPDLAGNPLLLRLGDGVIEEALAQLARWRAEGLETMVSVNVDAVQLHDPGFLARLRRQLDAQPGVEPRHLQIEILETGALQDMDAVSRLVRDLAAMGVSTALDDFGTGFSSLTFLKELGADVVKIDRSFVRAMTGDPEQAAIVESVIGLARSFRRDVLAEGVETEQHGRLLLELGCELGQGYGIAQPMPAHEVLAWLEAWQPPASWGDPGSLEGEGGLEALVEADHEALRQALEAHLAGEREALAGLDPGRCWIGRRLKRAHVCEAPGECGRLGLVLALHSALHAAAQHVVAAHDLGRDREVERAQRELSEAGDRLLSEVAEAARPH